ncbi:MAG: DUF4303 domain-containing protein [Hyphomonadaceae bacterium]
MARFAHPDFEALQQCVASAARGVFLRARKKRPDEIFFAYVLTTYGTGSLGGCCINTLQNHTRVWNEALRQSYTKPDDEHYYKWCCADWGDGEYVDDHQDVFMEAWEAFERAMQTYRRLLTDAGQDDSDALGFSDDHPLHNALADALEQLDREGVFGAGEERRNALVFMTQYDGEDEVFPWSIARLNPQASEALKREALSWV